MSSNKRQKTSATSATVSSPNFARLNASQPTSAAASSAAAGSSSQRRVVGRRSLPPASSQQLVDPQASPPAVPLDDDDEDDPNDWTYPEPAAFMANLPPNVYQYHLTPASAPVFSKYKQAGLDAIVGEVMKFILMKSSANQVITHKDILMVLNERCKSGTTQILADCKRRFMELYGYELHELAKLEDVSIDTKKRKTISSAPATTTTKTYILRTPKFDKPSPALRLAYNHDLYLDHEHNPAMARKGFLFWIYALIHAKESAQGNSQGSDQIRGCTEAELWRMAKRINIEKDMKNHEIFGNIANLIDEFVKQHYLIRLKIPGDPNADTDAGKSDQFSYRIGHRGQAEISTKDVYLGMCENVIGCEPNLAHIKQIARNEELARGRQQGIKFGLPKSSGPSAAAPPASQR